jgi:UrcA family protein
MSTSTLTAVLAAAVLATGVGFASTVLAADQGDVSATVKYADLNLSTQDGAKAMLQRVVQAAKLVCRPDADIADLPGEGDWLNACVSSRVREAVSCLDAPMVTAAYYGAPRVSVLLRPPTAEAL